MCKALKDIAIMSKLLELKPPEGSNFVVDFKKILSCKGLDQCPEFRAFSFMRKGVGKNGQNNLTSEQQLVMWVSSLHEEMRNLGINAKNVSEHYKHFELRNHYNNHIEVNVKLTLEQQQRLQSIFPNLHIKFTESRKPLEMHSYSHVSRLCMRANILDLIGYSHEAMKGYDYKVIDVGGRITQTFYQNQVNIHVEQPILTYHDLARLGNDMVAVQSFITKNINKFYNGKRNYSVMMAMKAKNNYLEMASKVGVVPKDSDMSTNGQWCFAKSQCCDVTGYACMFLHSAYDIDTKTIADIMYKKKSVVGYMAMYYDRLMHIEVKGHIERHGVNWRIYVDPVTKRKKISFHFTNDLSISYVHDYETYISKFETNQFVSTNGVMYITEQIADHDGEVLIKITTLPNIPVADTKSPLVKVVDIPMKQDMVVVTYYELDEKMSYSASSGKVAKYFIAKPLIIPQAFYESICSFLCKTSSGRFTPENTLRAAATYNSTVTIDNKDIIRRVDLPVKEVMAVAHAAYIEMYIAKESHKETSKYIIEEHERVKQFNSKPLLIRIMLTILTIIDNFFGFNDTLTVKSTNNLLCKNITTDVYNYAGMHDHHLKNFSESSENDDAMRKGLWSYFRLTNLLNVTSSSYKPYMRISDYAMRKRVMACVADFFPQYDDGKLNLDLLTEKFVKNMEKVNEFLKKNADLGLSVNSDIFSYKIQQLRSILEPHVNTDFLQENENKIESSTIAPPVRETPKDSGVKTPLDKFMDWARKYGLGEKAPNYSHISRDLDNFYEKPVPGDGDCLLHTLTYLMFSKIVDKKHSPNAHNDLRALISKYIGLCMQDDRLMLDDILTSKTELEISHAHINVNVIGHIASLLNVNIMVCIDAGSFEYSMKHRVIQTDQWIVIRYRNNHFTPLVQTTEPETDMKKVPLHIMKSNKVAFISHIDNKVTYCSNLPRDEDLELQTSDCVYKNFSKTYGVRLLPKKGGAISLLSTIFLIMSTYLTLKNSKLVIPYFSLFVKFLVFAFAFIKFFTLLNWYDIVFLSINCLAVDLIQVTDLKRKLLKLLIYFVPFLYFLVSCFIPISHFIVAIFSVLQVIMLCFIAKLLTKFNFNFSKVNCCLLTLFLCGTIFFSGSSYSSAFHKEFSPYEDYSVNPYNFAVTLRDNIIRFKSELSDILAVGGISFNYDDTYEYSYDKTKRQPILWNGHMMRLSTRLIKVLLDDSKKTNIQSVFSIVSDQSAYPELLNHLESIFFEDHGELLILNATALPADTGEFMVYLQHSLNKERNILYVDNVLALNADQLLTLFHMCDPDYYKYSAQVCVLNYVLDKIDDKGLWEELRTKLLTVKHEDYADAIVTRLMYNVFWYDQANPPVFDVTVKRNKASRVIDNTDAIYPKLVKPIRNVIPRIPEVVNYMPKFIKSIMEPSMYVIEKEIVEPLKFLHESYASDYTVLANSYTEAMELCKDLPFNVAEECRAKFSSVISTSKSSSASSDPVEYIGPLLISHEREVKKLDYVDYPFHLLSVNTNKIHIDEPSEYNVVVIYFLPSIILALLVFDILWKFKFTRYSVRTASTHPVLNIHYICAMKFQSPVEFSNVVISNSYNPSSLKQLAKSIVDSSGFDSDTNSDSTETSLEELKLSQPESSEESDKFSSDSDNEIVGDVVSVTITDKEDSSDVMESELIDDPDMYYYDNSEDVNEEEAKEELNEVNYEDTSIELIENLLPVQVSEERVLENTRSVLVQALYSNLSNADYVIPVVKNPIDFKSEVVLHPVHSYTRTDDNNLRYYDGFAKEVMIRTKNYAETMCYVKEQCLLEEDLYHVTKCDLMHCDSVVVNVVADCRNYVENIKKTLSSINEELETVIEEENNRSCNSSNNEYSDDDEDEDLVDDDSFAVVVLPYVGSGIYKRMNNNTEEQVLEKLHEIYNHSLQLSRIAVVFSVTSDAEFNKVTNYFISKERSKVRKDNVEMGPYTAFSAILKNYKFLNLIDSGDAVEYDSDTFLCTDTLIFDEGLQDQVLTAERLYGNFKGLTTLDELLRHTGINWELSRNDLDVNGLKSLRNIRESKAVEELCLLDEDNFLKEVEDLVVKDNRLHSCYYDVGLKVSNFSVVDSEYYEVDSFFNKKFNLIISSHDFSSSVKLTGPSLVLENSQIPALISVLNKLYPIEDSKIFSVCLCLSDDDLELLQPEYIENPSNIRVEIVTDTDEDLFSLVSSSYNINLNAGSLRSDPLNDRLLKSDEAITDVLKTLEDEMVWEQENLDVFVNASVERCVLGILTISAIMKNYTSIVKDIMARLKGHENLPHQKLHGVMKSVESKFKAIKNTLYYIYDVQESVFVYCSKGNLNPPRHVYGYGISEEGIVVLDSEAPVSSVIKYNESNEKIKNSMEADSDFKKKMHRYNVQKQGTSFYSDKLCMGRYVVLFDSLKCVIEPKLVSGIMNSISNVYSRNVPDTSLIEGVPGCGKTTRAVKNFPDYGMVVCSTRSAVKDVSDRIRKLHMSEENNTGTVTYDRIKTCVRTSDSIVVNGFNSDDHEVNELVLDEALMKHPGEILPIILLTNPKCVRLIGDTQQIPFVNRTQYLHQYKSIQLPVTEYLNNSYRCPADVISTVANMYSYGVTSSNDIRSSRNAKIIKALADIPLADHDWKKTSVLTFKQNEKQLMIDFFSSLNLDVQVNTIHEFQGNQNENIVVIRAPKHSVVTESLYHRKNYALVAITRHTKSFTYYTCFKDVLYKLATNTISDEVYSKYLLGNVGKSKRGGYVKNEVSVFFHSNSESLVVKKKGYSVVDPIVSSVVDANPTIATERVKIYDLNSETHKCFNTRDFYMDDENIDFKSVYYNPNTIRDIPVIQQAIAYVTPLASNYNNEMDQMIMESSDLNFHFGGGISLTTSPIVVQEKAYDCLQPVIKTSAFPNREKSLKAFLNGLYGRNACVPDLIGDVNQEDLGGLIFDNFIEMFDSSLLRQFQEHKIGVNEESIKEWFLLTRSTEYSYLSQADDFNFLDNPINRYDFSVKPALKPKYDYGYDSSYPVPQTIAAHSKAINVIACPIIKQLKERVIKALPPHILPFMDMAPEDFVHEMNKKFSVSSLNQLSKNEWFKKLELDISKYDKSQGEATLVFECMIMRAFGVEEEFVNHWFAFHHYAALVGKIGGMQHVKYDVMFQRKSGEASTLLGNTLFTLGVLLLVFPKESIKFLVVAGDDSVVWFDRRKVNVESSTEYLSNLVNLETKEFVYDYTYFCGKYLIPATYTWFFVPDPIKLAVKLGRRDVLDYDHLEEYRVSTYDNFKLLCSVEALILVDEAIKERISADLELAYGFVPDFSFIPLMCSLKNLASQSFNQLFVPLGPEHIWPDKSVIRVNLSTEKISHVN